MTTVTARGFACRESKRARGIRLITVLYLTVAIIATVNFSGQCYRLISIAKNSFRCSCSCDLALDSGRRRDGGQQLDQPCC